MAKKKTIPTTPYKISTSKLKELANAIDKYNTAVRRARLEAGLGDYELNGLAMPTTLPNTVRRIKNTKEANKVIRNLLEFTQKGGTEFVYSTDETTGEITDMRFKAQIKQLNRAVAAENVLREKARVAAKNTDTRIYNPAIDVDIKNVDRAQVEKRRGTSPIDIGVTSPIISRRTENWKTNYIGRLETAIEKIQKEHGALAIDVERVRALEIKILNATIEEVNYMIYNEISSGSITDGPYEHNVLFALDKLEREWDRAFAHPWSIFGG